MKTKRDRAGSPVAIATRCFCCTIELVALLLKVYIPEKVLLSQPVYGLRRNFHDGTDDCIVTLVADVYVVVLRVMARPRRDVG